jgi:uncharacterized protein
MPQYLSPGVYVEEIDAGPQPIQGVSTSVTGAVGVTAQGPTSGKPVLVTSFADFQNTFGGFLPAPLQETQNQWSLDADEGGRWWQFPLSVKGFFDNGGEQLYVKRVFAGGGGVPGMGATAASAEFGQGLIADIAQDANATATTVKLSHLIDVDVGKSLRFWAAGKAILANPFTVLSYNSTLNTVTLDKPVGFALRAGRDYVVIEKRSASPTPAGNVTLQFAAKALGDWGNGISVRVAPMVGGTFNILPNPAAGGASFSTQLSANAAAGDTTIAVADASGFAAGDHARISGQEYALTVVSTPSSAAAAAGAATIAVADPSNLATGDQALILGQKYTLAVVQTQLTASAAAGAATVTVADASGFANGVQAAISGAQYTLTIVQTQLSAAAAAGAGTIAVADASSFNNGDQAVISGTRYTLTIDETQVTAAQAVGAVTIALADASGFVNGDHARILGQDYTLANVNAAAKTVDVNPALVAAVPVGTAVVRSTIGVNPVLAAAVPAGTAVVRSTVGVNPVLATTVPAGAAVVRSAVGVNPVLVAAIPAGTAVVDQSKIGVAPGLVTAVPGGTSISRLRQATAAAATTIHVSGASQIYDSAILQFDNGTNKETVIVQPGGVSGEVVTFLPALQHVYYEGQKVRLIEAEVDVQNTVNGVVAASEVWQNLRLHDDQTTSFIVTGVNLQSAFVNVQTAPPANGGGFSETDLTLFPTAPGNEWVPLSGGADNLGQLTIDDFVGVDGGFGKRTGIQALEDVSNISICIVPGMWSTTIQAALINHCESLRYRFAILDPNDGLTIDQIIAFREPLDTKFAALYYPWLQVLDPSVVRNVNVAPSGHMAGIFAQTDNDRGVFKAPANVEIGLIKRIAQEVNKREQDLLNPIGINALRFFPERGNRVWGARTLSSESAWKYINVKRLFIYVEASIDVGTQWVVFEPNDEPLWARIRQTITDFLTTTWLSGALQGTTAAEAFFVRCDKTTMTQDDIDNGRLICVIGIAPVKPAEFVIFRIQQFTQATVAA